MGRGGGFPERGDDSAAHFSISGSGGSRIGRSLALGHSLSALHGVDLHFVLQLFRRPADLCNRVSRQRAVGTQQNVNLVSDFRNQELFARQQSIGDSVLTDMFGQSIGQRRAIQDAPDRVIEVDDYVSVPGPSPRIGAGKIEFQ